MHIEKLFPDEKVRAESAYVYFSTIIRNVLAFGEEKSLAWPDYSFQYENNWINNKVRNENYCFRIKYGVYNDDDDADNNEEGVSEP